MPAISVVMSVFNGEKYVKRAIDSILSQTFVDFEFIIIDDGSSDKTLNILNEYRDKRIKIIHHTNRGLTSSLNKAIKLSKSNYIARQDADDFSHPDRLAEQFNHFTKNPSITALATRAAIQNGKSTYLSNFYSKVEIKRKMKFKNIFIHSTVMIKKDNFEKIGYYNESYKRSQDYDAWIRLADIGDLEMINKVLVTREITENSISKKKLLEQCLNTFKIRSGRISMIRNIVYTLYMLLSNLIPLSVIQFIKLKSNKKK